MLLLVLLQLYDRTHPPAGTLSGAYLLGYGLLRFTAEHFREPDSFLEVLGLGLSMGQWLCLPMILAGAALWLWSIRRARIRRLVPAAA